MTYLAKLSGVAFLAAWLTVGPICAAYAATFQTVYATIEWEMPADAPEWAKGKEVQVRAIFGCGIGSPSTYYGYGTLDYGQAQISGVFETTGAQPNYHWGMVAWIPAQFLHGGPGQTYWISGGAPQSFAYRKGTHSFRPTEFLFMVD